ncbi:MAG: diaminohydroxyphosphoribosylaminopyrimidine deaminase, partial [Bacteroidia bacterium]
APKWLLWLVGPMFGVTRQFVRDNVGFPWQADNSKIKTDLGMSFKPISESVNEFFAQVVESGAFNKK